MSTYRVEMNGQEDDHRNDEPTAEELREIPPMESTAELREMMKGEDYKTSRLVRALVVESLKKSAPNVGAIQSQAGQRIDVGNELEARMDATKQLFRDPRYKTSALYRQQVTEMIRQHSNEQVQPGDVMRVGFSPEPGRFAKQEGISTIRVTFETQKTGPNKPEPKPAKPHDPNIIDLY
jgi:hypothetical protein